jgi:aspartyl-tRNA(Asn)/glutamyl-tRNA(Gln) amidotransferase subunit C
MKIDSHTLSKLAHLARLEFDPNAEKKMLNDLSNILDWVEQLNELDTDGVEPLTNMTSEVNVLRDDQPKESLSHERGLANAPKKDSNYFRVPKVME